jgi:uncharacterized membrane protein AbrB (regulator of aidB expression)
MVPLTTNLWSIGLFVVLAVYIYFNLFFVLYPNMPQWYYAVSTSMIGAKLAFAFYFTFKRDPGTLTKSDYTLL